jgi:endonuclease G
MNELNTITLVNQDNRVNPRGINVFSRGSLARRAVWCLALSLTTLPTLSANSAVAVKPSPTTAATTATTCAALGDLGKPGTRGVFLCRKGYALAFDVKGKVPLWVVESLTRERSLIFDKGRRRPFTQDPDLPPGTSPRNEDFRGGVYDKGHMAPAEDSDWDADASSETYYLSNVAPMVGRKLNRTLWKRLEEEVRNWAQCSNQLHVVTGPLLPTNMATAQRIGPSGLVVPTHFYKVVYQPSTRRAAAFLVPNVEQSGKEFERFATSVDEVEKRMGLDFFAALPDALEAEVEARVSSTPWRITNRGLDCQLQAR